MISIREATKNLYFYIAGSDPALRLRLSVIKHRRSIIILNFHRVSQDDGSAYRPLNPNIFDDILFFLKRNFSIDKAVDQYEALLFPHPSAATGT